MSHYGPYVAFAVIGLYAAGLGYLVASLRSDVRTGVAAILAKLDTVLDAAKPLTADVVATGVLTPHVIEGPVAFDGLSFEYRGAPGTSIGLAEPKTEPVRIVVDHVDDPTPTSEIAIPRISQHPSTKPIPAAELIARIQRENGKV